MFPRGVGVREDRAHGRGHAGRGHDLLGEALAAFKLRAVRVRPEAGDARGHEPVGDAEGQGQLRAGHGEVDMLAPAEVRKAVEVVHGQGHVTHAVGLRAAVAGRHEERFGVLPEFPGERVLATSGTDDENTHAASLRVARGQARAVSGASAGSIAD